jgi:hypothetical protein
MKIGPILWEAMPDISVIAAQAGIGRTSHLPAIRHSYRVPVCAGTTDIYFRDWLRALHAIVVQGQGVALAFCIGI